MSDTTITPESNPTRKQSSLGGNVVKRVVSNTEQQPYLLMATVTKVYYQKGTLDYSSDSTSTLTQGNENYEGQGSAPIPIDFFGTNAKGEAYGHYRPIQTGNRVLLAFVGGYTAFPIVVGVYPDSQSNYELISPVEYNTGDDTIESTQQDTLSERKVYSNQQIMYRSGSGNYLRTMNGKSFMFISNNDMDYLSDISYNYEQLLSQVQVGNDTIYPDNEDAQAWLLIHEDNPDSDNSDGHRTRFYINKQGEFQLIFMSTTDSTSLAMLEGSKKDGFTLTKRYDNNDITEDSTDYVSLNLGDDTSKSFKIVASSEKDSKTQSSSLEVNSTDVFVNGESLTELISNGSGEVTSANFDDYLSSSDYYTQLQSNIETANQNAQNASEAAQTAGEQASDAGAKAEEASEDAKAQAEDIKNKIIYYASISDESDVYIQGKYLIINTDTYIENGVIKNAYIEDGAIDQAKIATAAVGTAQIEDLAVTQAQIANLAVGTAQIEDLAITDAKVGTLSFNHMIGEKLDANVIDVVNLHGDNITVGTITADKLIITSLGDITSNLGTVTSGNITAGDGTTGVNISGLDADNPNEYTASKKSQLKAQIAILEASANSAITYGEATGNDYSAINTAKNSLLNGTSSLLSDMSITTSFDSTEIQTWETALQTAIADFQSTVNSALDKKIGTTADGKNSIDIGTTEPSNPNVGDLFLKKQTDGTYITEIYSENGWISPTSQAVNEVAQKVASIPQDYYSATQPSGTNYIDGDKWYQTTVVSGKITYVMHKWDISTNTWSTMSDADAVQVAEDYNGVTIDSSGLNATAGSTTVAINSTDGFVIEKSGVPILSADTNGNLTLTGAITSGGTISGVNFAGDNLTLAGTLGVTGSISATNGNVVINSSGINIKGANLSISDSNGNTTTYIQSDGTFVTNKGVFSGSISSNDVTITGGSISMNGGVFSVDSQGNVIANSFTSTNSSLSSSSISDSAITGSSMIVDDGNGRVVTVSGGVIDAVNNPKNPYYNIVYNSEFADINTTMLYGWTLDANTKATSSVLSPMVNNSTKLSTNPSGLTPNSWYTVASSIPMSIISTTTPYSMSAQVDILSDTTLGFDTVRVTLSFYDKNNSRSSWYDATADLTIKDAFQKVSVLNKFPDANAISVGIQFWVHTSATGTGGHVNFTQPYVTPFATIDDYLPDTISSNQETIIRDGYLQFPLTESYTGGDYGSLNSTGYYILSGGTFLSSNGYTSRVLSRFATGTAATPWYYEYDVINLSNNDLSFTHYDDDGYYGGYINTSADVSASGLIVRNTSVSMTYGPTGVVTSGDISLSPGGNVVVSTGGFVATAGGSHIRNTQIDNELWVNGKLEANTFNGFVISGNNIKTAGTDLWVDSSGGSGGTATVHAKSFSQTSLLSKKTNIAKLDTQDVVNAINSTEIYEYSYKGDLEQGINKRYASYIIDDVNDVTQYNEPSAFLSEDGKGRDDGTQLAYLTLMVQEMYKTIQEQSEEIKKLESN